MKNEAPHILHLVFHLPAESAAQSAADWALVELARRHAPDLAPLLLGEAVGRIAPHFVGLAVAGEAVDHAGPVAVLTDASERAA